MSLAAGHACGDASNAANEAFNTVARPDPRSLRTAGGKNGAGLERNHLGVQSDERVRPMGHVSNVVTRELTPIVDRYDLQRVHVGHFILCDDYGAEAEECVKALRSLQVASVASEHVERSHIERHGVAEQDVLERLDRHLSAVFTEHETQLPLGIDVVGKIGRRQLDRTTRFEERRGRLHEAARLLGLRFVQVLGVRFVVQADAPDLRR